MLRGIALKTVSQHDSTSSKGKTTDLGALLAPENTWHDVPEASIIIGLKELPVAACELIDV